MIYFNVWSGNYDAPSMEFFDTMAEADAALRRWSADIREEDRLDMYSFDPETKLATHVHSIWIGQGAWDEEEDLP